MIKKKFALLAVGEILGDFIGTEIKENIYETSIFERFQGGSPANLAANMARLGYNTTIVGAVGNDGLGKYLVDKIEDAGVDVSNIIICDEEPTSIVLVSRTRATPDFIPYRTADKMIKRENISDELLENSSIFHTTCWPLSKQPSQSAVLDAAKKARALGLILSADLNYAEKVWPERLVAQAIVREFLSFGPLIKLSEDDANRFYGETVERDRIFKDFHEWGAEVICYTMGERGSIVSFDKGEGQIVNVPESTKVMDATGAGDSFWSGFLAAYLEKKTMEQCAKAGANMARIKLQTIGPIKVNVNLEELI